MPNKRYIVAGCRPWNREAFDRSLAGLPGRWSFVSRPAELAEELGAGPAPRYVFFLHWNWKVPAEVFEAHDCVCFHMTDVPYGRGGSPLQNLILRGHERTMLTALRMVEAMDAGPVYLKRDLGLEGRAEDIYRRGDALCVDMIRELAATEPEPVPQQGEPTVFARRTPDQSRIPALDDPRAVYDFIRMLDAPEYPLAFIDQGGFRFLFSHARLKDGEVEARVRIVKSEEEP